VDARSTNATPQVVVVKPLESRMELASVKNN
jgi:hypothetical protein